MKKRRIAKPVAVFTINNADGSGIAKVLISVLANNGISAICDSLIVFTVYVDGEAKDAAINAVLQSQKLSNCGVYYLDNKGKWLAF